MENPADIKRWNKKNLSPQNKLFSYAVATLLICNFHDMYYFLNISHVETF